VMGEKTIIGVFCYKRAAKLKASIEALLKNPECAQMDIIFFCDGHKGEKDLPGVLATREYINSLTGFRNIHKHFRERNVSTGPNFFAGINFLRENYDRFIVVEDDLVVTPNYVRYMLDALDFYNDEKSIFCISGFAFPLQKKGYQYDTIIHGRFCSYGWASWSDRVRKVIWDKEELQELLTTSPGFKSQLNKQGFDLHRLLKKQLSGAISTWDIQMQVNVARHGLKVVYPVLSKAHNIGFDNESTNTFGLDYLKTTTDPGDKRSFNFCPVDLIEPFLQKQLKKPYGLQALATRKIINTFIKLTAQLKGSS
jgi:hypothetical protein